jgi:hypothetical protein
VVVAVAVVRVMQMAADQIVDMTAMRDGFVPATWAVNVAGGVAGAGVGRSAGVRIGGRDGQGVLVKMVSMRLMEVAVVEIIGVAVMFDGSVAAAGSMDVRMIFVDLMMCHDCSCSGWAEKGGACAGVSLAWAMALKTRSRTCWSARA